MGNLIHVDMNFNSLLIKCICQVFTLLQLSILSYVLLKGTGSNILYLILSVSLSFAGIFYLKLPL
jgi:hypothetical protein